MPSEFTLINHLILGIVGSLSGLLLYLLLTLKFTGRADSDSE